MGKAVPVKQAAEDEAAERLLSSFQNLSAVERRRHATIFHYWLAIRGNRQFPPIRDLDPLEISDAAPCSVLLEMIGSGEDAEIRHLGSALDPGTELTKISQAPDPSLLACIAAKLPVLATTMQAVTFEDEFATASGTTRCWVTLLPFSSTGTWIDFAYGFVSLEAADASAEAETVAVGPDEQTAAAPEPPEATAEPEPAPTEPDHIGASEAAQPEPEPEPAPLEPEPEPPALEPKPEPLAQAPAGDGNGRPAFSRKIFEALAGVGGFYGTHVKVDPILPPVSPEIDCPAEQPMQNKLAEVRAKADEARLAKIRSNLALYEGLGAAYDFALDAEAQPEEYLKLVAAEGIKIQLRAPMAPVVKLAFNGMCDDSNISHLEAVLAWALQRDLPRGTLAKHIEAEGGIDAILSGAGAA